MTQIKTGEIDVSGKPCQFRVRTESGEGCIHFINGGMCTMHDKFHCTDWLAAQEIRLSYSQTDIFSSCRLRWWFRYGANLELIEKPIHMTYGILAGQCLAYIHTTSKPEYQGLDNIFDNLLSTDEPPIGLTSVKALMYSYLELDIEKFHGKAEYPFEWSIPEHPKVIGYLDLAYDVLDEIPYSAYEFKYSSRPENYTKFTTQRQIGTYFLGVPSLKKIKLRVIRHPDLRLGKKEGKDEFFERVRKDVLARPKHYIIDTTFWPEEYDKEKIKNEIRMVAQDIRRYSKLGKGAFYPSPKACLWPYECDYFKICESGLDMAPENLYKIKEVREHEGKDQG